MLFVSSAEDMWLKEEFEDTKEVIRICNSEKDRKNNGQKGKGIYKTLGNFGTSNSDSSNTMDFSNFHKEKICLVKWIKAKIKTV